MRETKFIEQNHEKWREFEHLLESKEADPSELNRLFVQIMDDLSFSQTFYHNRSVRVYLNGLAQQVFFRVYKYSRPKWEKFKYFWTDELPQLVWNARRAFLVAFVVFALAVLIGAFSSAKDPNFVATILGDDYVRMTNENIKANDPMAVYKQKGAAGMALGITANNIFVAFICFMSGVVFAIGSLVALIQNGVMVGAFQYFFYEKGVFWDSFFTIWLHGTLEISSIIIAGAAGITMGEGLVFPDTYTRLQAFQLSARRGLKIMVGIVPVLMMAGAVEGFFTRYTNVPNALRGAFMALSLFFILAYFVFYPRKKAIEGFKAFRPTALPPSINQVIDFQRIKTSGELFSETFSLFNDRLGSLLRIAALSSAFYCVFVFIQPSISVQTVFEGGYSFFSFLHVSKYFQNEQIGNLFFISMFALWLVTTYTLILFRKKLDTEIPVSLRTYAIQGLFCLAPVLLFHYLLCFDTVVGLLLVCVALPLLLLWMHSSNEKGINLFTAFTDVMSLFFSNILYVIRSFLLLFIILLLTFNLAESSVLYMYYDFIGWNFEDGEYGVISFLKILSTFTTIFLFLLFYSTLIIHAGLLYFSLKEMQNAEGLHAQVLSIRLKNQIRGLDKE